MKLVIEKVISMISQTFPKAVILPSLGNNDVVHHYQAPTSDEAAGYYQDLWDLFFSTDIAIADKQI